MVRIVNLLILILFLTFICGCVSNDVFHKKSRGNWVSKKSYCLTDTLLVNNYALYNSRNEVLLIPNKEPFEVNKDSLILVFKSSLQKLDLDNLKLEFGENIIDSILYLRYGLRIKHLNKNYIKNIAEYSKGITALVPIVYVQNQYSFTASFTSGGAFSNNGWYFITYLSLIVVVIEKDEIIYSRHIRYKSDQVWADTKSEIEAMPPLAAVKQEHWDELVRLAMEDYIKRLK